MKRRKTRKFKRFAHVILAGILLVCLAAGGYVCYLAKSVRAYPINLDEVRTELSGGSSGGAQATALAEDKGRDWVGLSLVPKNLTDAVVSTEDKGFYTNDGVDYRRTFEAAANTVFHFFKTDQGGSTITQQVVKNLEGNVDDRTYENKLREIKTAYDLDKEYSKDQIMEIYVNIVTLGDNCYGVQAASRLYFGKDVNGLDLAQCATLAAILPSPNLTYNPYKNPENVAARRKLVLGNMLAQGMITKAQYTAAASETVTYRR